MSEIPKPDDISITTWKRFRNEISEIQAEAAPRNERAARLAGTSAIQPTVTIDLLGDN